MGHKSKKKKKKKKSKRETSEQIKEGGRQSQLRHRQSHFLFLLWCACGWADSELLLLLLLLPLLLLLSFLLSASVVSLFCLWVSLVAQVKKLSRKQKLLNAIAPFVWVSWFSQSPTCDFSVLSSELHGTYLQCHAWFTHSQIFPFHYYGDDYDFNYDHQQRWRWWWWWWLLWWR